MPEVSVIIPTYNRAHLIGRAILSVLRQSYQDFEIIVLDDCSTDNTEELIDEMKKKDKRIRYIRHEKNKGPAVARNSGIKNAKGEYIAFQDSDDEWLPEKLEKQIKIFRKEKHNIGVVYTGMLRIRNNKIKNIPPKFIKKNEGYIHKELLKGNFIGNPSVVIRKECFKKIGYFNVILPCLEDWDLFIRISKFYNFKYIPENLVISHYTENGVNEKPFYINIRAIETIIENNLDDFKNNKMALSNQYFNIGLTYCLNGTTEKGRKYLIKAIKLYPYNLKYFLTILTTLFGNDFFLTFIKSYRKLRQIYLINKEKR
jgi:glycosyltransferase involved in cell wall biosynthesis